MAFGLGFCRGMGTRLEEEGERRVEGKEEILPSTLKMSFVDVPLAFRWFWTAGTTKKEEKHTHESVARFNEQQKEQCGRCPKAFPAYPLGREGRPWYSGACKLCKPSDLARLQSFAWELGPEKTILSRARRGREEAEEGEGKGSGRGKREGGTKCLGHLTSFWEIILLRSMFPWRFEIRNIIWRACVLSSLTSTRTKGGKDNN